MMMYLLQSDVRSSWEGEVGGETEGRKRSRMFVGKFKLNLGKRLIWVWLEIFSASKFLDYQPLF